MYFENNRCLYIVKKECLEIEIGFFFIEKKEVKLPLF